MQADMALRLVGDLLWTGLLVCAPVLGLTMLVGLVISLLQVLTQIQEMSLTFVPKLGVAVLTMVFFGPWMLRTLMTYTTRLWTGIASLS